MPCASRLEADELEQEVDDQPGGSHRGVEGHEQERGHTPAVVLAVDVEDRQDDQVGEDERDHAAETDPAVPQHGSERDVADRAHEREHRHQRPDQRPPDGRKHAMVLEEQTLPERVWHPRC